MPAEGSDPDLLATVSADDFAADPGTTIGVPPAEEERVDAAHLENSVELGAVLGRGGMAVVREARQRVMDRSVAIKSSSKEGERGDGILLQEARITGALEHPGILPVHDILVDGTGRPHIVMKRIDGLPWGDLMGDPVEVEARFGSTDLLGWNLEILIAVCHALEFAHAMGVIHRDLKPDNVMVAAYGQVYVLDWGIAVSVDPDETRFPKASEQDRLSGTPRYMAPEMLSLEGLKGLSPRTDVYQLGAVLYCILEGRPPHRGLDLKAILAGIPTFVPSLPNGPVELETILERAMAIRAEDRYPSVAELRRALQAFQSHRGAVAISERAAESLEKLTALLESPDSSRIAVYDLFGQVRFGFLEALRIWPESPAQKDLHRALEAMATWELDQGDDRAAEVLLAQLSEVPEGLSEQLDAVRSDRASKRDRLQRLAQRSDPSIGRNLRIGAAVVMMVLWGTGPWLSSIGLWVDYIITGVFLLVAIAMVAGGWKQLTATRRNRVFITVLLAGLTGNLWMTVGAATGALEKQQMLHAVWGLNGTVALFCVFLLDIRFLLPTLLYLVCFQISPQLDSIRPFVASLLNTIMAGTAVWSFLRR